LALFALATSGCGRLHRAVSPPPVAFSGEPPAPPSDNASYTAIVKTIFAGGIPAVERVYGQPVASFKMPDITNSSEPSGTYRLADGRKYVFSWGFDASDVPMVVRHAVLATEGATLTSQDAAFVAAIHDGRTTMSEMDAYLTKVSHGKWIAVSPRTSTTRDVIWLWLNPDGTGFTISSVRGHRSLGWPQYAGVPYVVWDWPANHLWAITPGYE
jgi:hypothetical protein